ncbi:Ankyrin repeat-containing protein [Acorus gramineus]|uniref:Ankyrin repeat-containing protein n=1 Tax=Acorus gramineus TaxID=55184 RepID=A0AAV8ZZT7_ACOGR|nr:Ankyrin repeat-containing protein [Acorus gramineus]
MAAGPGEGSRCPPLPGDADDSNDPNHSVDPLDGAGAGAIELGEEDGPEVVEEVREAGDGAAQRHGAPPGGAERGPRGGAGGDRGDRVADDRGGGGEEFDADVAEVRLAVVSEVNEVGETPLFIAAERGHLALVEELLKWLDKEGVAKKNRSGFDALHIAVREGHKAGFTINTKD